MKVDLVIPVQRYTAQLEKSLQLHDRFSNDVETELHIVEDPTVNVSEARQNAMHNYGRYVCFLDDDSEMVMDHWLDEMLSVLLSDDQNAAAFSTEWWGTNVAPQLGPLGSNQRIRAASGLTPAACMLLDTEKLRDVEWDQNIGLRNGWLGGDFEEVDFCYRIERAGLKLSKAAASMFHHTGGKTDWAGWSKTDRCVCVQAMRQLLNYKYAKAPNDDDWFKGLKYVKADPDNDCMLAPGSSLRACYSEVLRRNGLQTHRQFIECGLV